jgi:hypothetical protein
MPAESEGRGGELLNADETRAVIPRDRSMVEGVG